MKTFCEVNDFLICRKGLDFFLISSLKFIVKLFVGAFWRDFPEGTSNIGRLIFTAGHSLSLFKTQRTALAKTFDFFFLYSALCCDPLKQARHISSVSFPSHTVLPYAPQSPYILPFAELHTLAIRWVTLEAWGSLMTNALSVTQCGGGHLNPSLNAYKLGL